MGQKKKNWPYHRGWLKFHVLRAVITNTPYIEFNVLFSFLAKRRAARFIISTRACITQPSHGQRDFLLAINLSSLVGVRLEVQTEVGWYKRRDVNVRKNKYY